MRKFWLAITVLTMLYSCQETNDSDNRLVDFLPSDASFVVSTKNLDSLLTMLERNKVINLGSNSEVYTGLKTIAKTVKPDSLWGKMYVAISTQPNGEDFYALAYDSDSLTFYEEAVKSFSSETLTSSRGKLELIKADSSEIYMYNSAPTYVFSNNKTWLETSASNFPFNNKKFRAYFQTTSNNNAFIAHNLEITAQSIFSEQADSIPKVLSQNLVLEFSLEENSVQLNGIAISDSTSNCLQNLNSHTKPRENKFSFIAPYDIDFAQSFTFDSYENFQKIYSIFSSDSLYSPANRLPNIVELALMKKSSKTAYGLLSLDIDATAEALGLAFPSETYRDIDIYQTPKEFSDLLASNKFVMLDSLSSCAKVGDFILLSNENETLKDYIANFQNETTLAKSATFSDLMENLSDESSLFLYFKGNTIENIGLENSAFSLNLKDSQSSAIQIINENNFAHVHAVFGNAPKSTAGPKVKELWQKNLDAPLLTEPKFLKNHRNSGMDIALQDVENNLYLISSNGTVYWKKQLDGKILGDIQQIDIYKNGRLQMAFSTPKTLYVLDRTGRDVSGFPVNLQHPITQPLSVFDYDNNKNYRLMLTQGKYISLFDKKGKVVRGFNYDVDGEINTAPQHFRISRKDYIVFSQGNKLEILTRRGQTRIRVKDTYNFSDNTILNYEDNFAFTTKDGALVQIDSKGGVSSAKLSLAEDHFVTSTNRTLVTLSDNILKIKDTDVELPFGTYTRPKIFYINNKIYITTTDLQTSKVYLYDSQGKSISDFPVYGSSAADLQNVDKDSGLELVVKGGDNSILLYQLN